MISTQNVSLQYGDRALFENVSIQFTEGNCYGIIGANGAGKSTFLKILSGEIEPNKGDVVITEGQRLSVLKQDHFAYDEQDVLKTVMMGNKRLFEIMQRKEELYSKPDFNDEDGLELADLEGEFLEMDGWNAETDAEILLNGLGVTGEFHHVLMKELGDQQKIKVLLAQALFGNPDILLLDEPTNHLDLKSINWLENFLLNFPNTVIVVSHDRHFLNKVCTHIADIDCLAVISVTIEHGKNHHGGVRNNMAVSGIFVIAEILVDILEAVPPVFGMPVMVPHHSFDDPCILAVLRDIGQSLIQYSANILFHKGQTDAASDVNAAVYAVASVRNAGRLFRQGSGLLRIAGRNQTPRVDKNLPADLLRHSRAILLHTAAAGRGNAGPQVQVGRVLRRSAVSPPPEKAVLIRGIVQQRFRHILRREFFHVLAVL